MLAVVVVVVVNCFRSPPLFGNNFIVVSGHVLIPFKLPPNQRRNPIVTQKPGSQKPTNHDLSVVVVGCEGGLEGVDQVQETVVVMG